MANRTPMPDVIVLIPGVLGSVLEKDGKTIWGPNWSAIKGVIPIWGNSLDQMTVIDDDPIHDLDDGISATKLMPDVHLIPGFWKIDGYATPRDEIIRNFAVTPGKNFFEFAYDWRRDNRYTAALLKRAAEGWLRSWRDTSGNPDAKLIIIGHSMGGLVARYYIEVLGGWRDTRALLTFGTPYRGAGKALGVLVNGVEKAFGLVNATNFVRSLTSVYQLLPTYKCFDEGNGKLVHLRSASLPIGVDPGRTRSAWFDFHQQIETAEKANRAEPDYPSFGHEQIGFPIRAVVGLRAPTLSTGFMLGDKLELIADSRIEHGDGDGTVPRVSATPSPKFQSSSYTSTKHASMQGVEGVLTDLFGYITSLYTDVGTYLGPHDARPKAAFDFEDAYPVGEPVDLTASLDVPNPGHQLQALVESTDRTRRGLVPFTSTDGQVFRAVLPELPADFYRITLVSGEDVPRDRRIEPVTDVFAMFDERAIAKAVDEP